jgi:ferrochelatase
MGYGAPSMESALRGLRDRGCDSIVVFPLYPQQASATTGSALEAAYRLAARLWNVPLLATVPPFYADRGFISAFAARARAVLDADGPDHLLFSFHGLPERQIHKSDGPARRCLASADCCAAVGPENRNCYRAQSFETARLLARALGLPDARWSVAFQSRLGRIPWIGPSTEEALGELARRGLRRLAVICPSFVADCLETLEEIGIRAAESFLAAGGESLRLVPSLNASPDWVDAAAALVRRAAPEPEFPRVDHRRDPGCGTGGGVE